MFDNKITGKLLNVFLREKTMEFSYFLICKVYFRKWKLYKKVRYCFMCKNHMVMLIVYTVWLQYISYI